MKAASKQSALIAEITAAFQDEPYPGDASMDRDSTGRYPAGLGIRDVFGKHQWQEVTPEVLFSERTGFSLMSNPIIKYYLPAYMCWLLQNSTVMAGSINMVVELLKLPTEIDVAVVTEHIQGHGVTGKLPDVDLNEMLQNQLAQTNERINAFISRASLFTQAQARAICHFLAYTRDESGDDFLSRDAYLAIQRYWFQFA